MKTGTKYNITTKKEMIFKPLISALLVSAVLILPPGISAQQENTQISADPAQIQAPPGNKEGMPKMQMMPKEQMEECDDMMSGIKEMDTRLDKKIADMDAAKGDQKVEAMAVVIKEMVSQRKEMQEYRMKMHDMNKGHMMEHMKRGTVDEKGRKKDK